MSRANQRHGPSIIFVVTIVVFFVGFAFSNLASADQKFEKWIVRQKNISIERMMKNISPAGTKPGTVIASPSREAPNYYFHWIRDASLTINTVVGLAENSKGAEQSVYLRAISDFISLSAEEQNVADFGEPRFNVDGTVDTIPWSRPQSDGPALRVLVLLRFLKSFPHQDNTVQISNIIFRDLSYIEKIWNEPCYDLWEELSGLHFYTQNVQYAALRGGAEFLGLERFSRAALTMKPMLAKYWMANAGYIGASHELNLGDREPTYKQSNLDTAAVLGVLHAGPEHSFYAVNDDEVLRTAQALEKLFLGIYKINEPAIGRFADDVYFGGNPWYMTTAAFAELYYRLARQADPVDKNKLMIKGDSFLKTIRRFVGSQGEMAEQFDRQAGVPASARDLTWSYAGFLSAVEARDEARTTTKPVKLKN